MARTRRSAAQTNASRRNIRRAQVSRIRTREPRRVGRSTYGRR